MICLALKSKYSAVQHGGCRAWFREYRLFGRSTFWLSAEACLKIFKFFLWVYWGGTWSQQINCPSYFLLSLSLCFHLFYNNTLQLTHPWPRVGKNLFFYTQQYSCAWINFVRVQQRVSLKSAARWSICCLFLPPRRPYPSMTYLAV